MKIVTDCAADLTPEDLASGDITTVPLFIQFPEGQVSSNDITPDDFYTRLREMAPDIPTTAQPSAGLFSEIYHKLAQKGEEILSIHISSGLSGTLNSARLGAEQVGQAAIHLIDSLTLSGGQRYQVLAAVQALKSGLSLEALTRRLEQVRNSTEVIYTLDTLTYLARGGRIGRVQALLGALLDLKPIIHVDQADGKYSTVGKARTLSRALGTLAEHLAGKYGKTAVRVSVLHGQLAEHAQTLAQLLQARLNVAQLEILRISPVLGVHTGPGIVGAAVVPIAAMETA